MEYNRGNMSKALKSLDAYMNESAGNQTYHYVYYNCNGNIQYMLGNFSLAIHYYKQSIKVYCEWKESDGCSVVQSPSTSSTFRRTWLWHTICMRITLIPSNSSKTIWLTFPTILIYGWDLEKPITSCSLLLYRIWRMEWMCRIQRKRCSQASISHTSTSSQRWVTVWDKDPLESLICRSPPRPLPQTFVLTYCMSCWWLFEEIDWPFRAWTMPFGCSSWVQVRIRWFPTLMFGMRNSFCLHYFTVWSWRLIFIFVWNVLFHLESRTSQSFRDDLDAPDNIC